MKSAKKATGVIITVRNKLTKFQETAQTDVEKAHGLREELYEYALSAVARGCKGHREIASTALKARDTELPW